MNRQKTLSSNRRMLLTGELMDHEPPKNSAVRCHCAAAPQRNMTKLLTTLCSRRFFFEREMASKRHREPPGTSLSAALVNHMEKGRGRQKKRGPLCSREETLLC